VIQASSLKQSRGSGGWNWREPSMNKQPPGRLQSSSARGLATGELRLARPNLIHRLCSKTLGAYNLAWGYLNENHDCTSVFSRSTSLLSSAVPCISLLSLTAMQVGLATNRLQREPGRSRMRRPPFTTIAIVGSVGVLVILVLGIVGYVFLLNLFVTLSNKWQNQSPNASAWESAALVELTCKGTERSFFWAVLPCSWCYAGGCR
jgi:hypothetical protein